jgi:hypothetical protein
VDAGETAVNKSRVRPRPVVLDGDDHLSNVGNAPAVDREVEQFLIGTADHSRRHPVLGPRLAGPLELTELR